MALISALANVRYWVVAGLIFGLVVGDIGVAGPMLIVGSLVLMMTISLLGLEFKKKDITERKKELAFAIICCYVISAGATLLVGSFFGGALWSGWVMIASVPCAVSVVSSTLIMKGDLKLALVSVTVVYVASLVITPLFTKALIGDAVAPFEILKYVLLFILVPLILSVPLKKVTIPINIRNIIINVCFFILVAIAFGSNRDFFFDEPVEVLWLAVASMIRLIAVFVLMEWILMKLKVPRDIRIVFVLIAVWKNSALAMTLTMLLIPDAEAALPAAIIVPLEMVWFMVMIWYYTKKCPPANTPQPTAANTAIDG